MADIAKRPILSKRSHSHFWTHNVPRSAFMRTAAGAAGAVAGADLLLPALTHAARRSDATPKPIPGGFSLGGPVFHVLGGPGAEPSSITDFNGVVGIAFIQGTGTGSSGGSGGTSRSSSR